MTKARLPVIAPIDKKSLNDQYLQDKCDAILERVKEGVDNLDVNLVYKVLTEEAPAAMGDRWKELLAIRYPYASPECLGLFLYVIERLYSQYFYRVVVCKKIIPVKDFVKLALFIIDNSDNELLMGRNNKLLMERKASWFTKRTEPQTSPLMMVAQWAEYNDVGLRLIERLSAEDVAYRAKGETALSIAQKHGNLVLVKAIEEKLDYVPPVSVVTAKAAIIEKLKDPRAQIRQAIDDGDVAAAMRIGQDILGAITRHTTFVADYSSRALISAQNAINASDQAKARIGELRNSFQEIAFDPSRLLPPTGWLAPVQKLIRRIPRFDPSQPLMQSFSQAGEEIAQALDASQKVVAAYQDFQKHLPYILESLTDLIDGIAEALADRGNVLASAPSDQVRRDRALVFQQLESTHRVASRTLASIHGQADTCQRAKEVEVAFTANVQDIQSRVTEEAQKGIAIMVAVKEGLFNRADPRLVAISQILGRMTTDVDNFSSALAVRQENHPTELASMGLTL